MKTEEEKRAYNTKWWQDHKEQKKKYYENNKETALVYAKEYRDLNKEELKKQAQTKWMSLPEEERKAITRTGRYKQNYGITIDQYEEMLKEQNNCCAICGQENNIGKRLFIDHNHQTGAIRKLLCQKCNSGLGHYDDDKEKLLKAVSYLTKHEDKTLAKMIEEVLPSFPSFS